MERKRDRERTHIRAKDRNRENKRSQCQNVKNQLMEMAESNKNSYTERETEYNTRSIITTVGKDT